MPHLTPEQQFALSAENHVAQWLQSHSIDVWQPTDFNEPLDALLEGFIPLETKASRVYLHNNGKGVKRQRWQFFLEGELPDHGLVVLVCYAPDDIYLFCVPSWLLKFRKSTHICITSHPKKYNGWLKRFLFSIKDVYHVISIAKRYSPLWVSFPE